MAADLSRYDDWLAFLRGLPGQVPQVRVVVVSGSAVTGGHDVHSDLDVQVWCDGLAPETYDATMALVHDRFEVDHVWRVAAGAWPTAAQGFVHLQPDAADLSRPTRLVDLWIEGKFRAISVSRQAIEAYLRLPAESGAILSEDDCREFVRTHLSLVVEAASARLRTDPEAQRVTIGALQPAPAPISSKERRQTDRRKGDRRQRDAGPPGRVERRG